MEKKEKKMSLNEEIIAECEVDVEAKTSCEDLENKFLLVRVGDRDKPASEDQLKQVREELDRIFTENGINCLLFVTHHAVSLDIIEKQ